MKTYFSGYRYAIALLILCLSHSFSSVKAQIIVQDGWDHDSIHCGTFGLSGLGMYPGFAVKDTGQIKRQMDTLGVNWANEWGVLDGTVDFGNHIYGSSSTGITGVFPDLNQLCKFKSLEWFAQPNRIPDRFHPGQFWQYFAGNIGDSASAHNFVYDSNDISPFTEFPKRAAFVTDTFTTDRFGSPTLVRYGDEGRVILGMSDNRDPKRLFKYQINPFFSPVPGTNRYSRDASRSSYPDTAKVFSVTLFFNADTKTANIDTSLSNGRSVNNLPLVRLQVLYKQGIDTADHSDHGQNTFPMVPFKTLTDSSKAGWWKILDTTITKAVYDNLPDDWHTADKLENGSESHSFKFKQLHVILKDIPPRLRDYLDAQRRLYNPALKDSAYMDFGTDFDGQPFNEHPASLTAFSNPDELVDDNLTFKPRHVIEMRVLSTYRTTVRVRSLTVQDTITDKFLFRKIDPATGKSHSCEPNGKLGGFDSVVNATAAAWSTAVGGKHWGVHFQDTWFPTQKHAYPMIAYVDFFGSQHNLYSHWHEQDDGGTSLYFRRNRLSFDGVPPSMFENEGQMFTGPILCPGDYIIAHTRLISQLTAWPNKFDTTGNGLVFTRRPLTGTTMFKAYNDFDSIYNGHVYYSHNIRGSVHTAHDHPANKRTAIEANMQAWGAYDSGVDWDPVHYVWNYTARKPKWDIKMAFPEEIVGTTLAFLADGVTSFNNPQIFYPGYANGGIPGALAVSRWHVDSTDCDVDSVAWVHDYNFGHVYSPWCEVDHHRLYTHDSNDVSGPLPHMYFGFSNTFLAQKRVLERINKIYGSTNGNQYPLTRMTWLDAYSNNLTVQKPGNPLNFVKSDSISKAKAFLKITNTFQVRPFQRDKKRAFIDSTLKDSSWRTIAEVGLFKDSISPSKVNYAALVVNTRLYPSLRDPYDSGYYNAPFSAHGQDSQRCASIYGDIDTRKIFMKIDTSVLPMSFRSGYYVVRDTWHPDTTWLVKADSQFAVYIKPGEGKFLYFEKSIAITAAPGATSSALDFAFNNGRRVAERMKGTRDIITYTRNDSLFVSTPLRGKFVEGNDQHSDGDNISTGRETCLDDGMAGKCHRPSICVGRNDTSVALVYWKEPGVLRVAFQAHPDSLWKFDHDTTGSFPDTTIDRSGVTPVCAPISDSTWVAVAAHQFEGVNGFGIVARRFKISRVGSGSTATLQLNMIENANKPEYIYSDTGTDISRFPTIATRPIADSLFPIRLAWQVAGKIRYRRFSWDTTGAKVVPILDKDTIISTGLPSDCQNFHPSIATVGINNFVRPLGTPGPLTITDYVAWEANMKDSGITTRGQFWPVMRISSQPFNRVKQTWQSSFQVFKPDTTSSGFRLPNVTAANLVSNVFITGNTILIGKPITPPPVVGFKNFVQIAWQNSTHERLEMAMCNGNGWYKGGLLERGLTPSQGLKTDAITNFGSIPRSLAFIGETPNVRITNGWSPWIDTVQLMNTKLRIVVKAKSAACTFVHKIVMILSDGLIGPIAGGPTTGIYWLPTDPTNGYVLPDGWPTGTPQNPAEIASTNFPLNTNDQITLNRSMAVDDTAQLRANLNSPTDTVSITYTLRRSVDSSAIAIIERQIVTKDTIIAAGFGLNPSMTLYPYLGPTDTGFISVQVMHSEADNLEREVVVLNDGDDLPLDSYKKAAPPKETAVPKSLSVAVIPNPFHSSTQITIEPVEDLPLTVTLYDELGRKVTELFNGIGDHERYEFTLTNSQLATGFYYLRIQNGTTVATKKVELLK